MQPEKKRRAQHAKSRRGCATCRTRRVKCDEAQPSCRNCTSTGRKCDGVSVGNILFVAHRGGQTLTRLKDSTQSPSKALSFHMQDVDEQRGFSFYLDRVAPCISGGLDASFWSVLVPQISQTNPVIWNAVMAISVLFEGFQLGETGPSHVVCSAVSEKFHRKALKWYNKSLRGLSAADKQRSETWSVIAVSCILYASIEFQQSNVTNAARLLKSASMLFTPDLETAAQSGQSLTTIQQCTFPILFRQYAHFRQVGQPLATEWWDLAEPLFSSNDIAEMTSLSHLRTQLHIIMHRTFQFVADAFHERMESRETQTFVLMQIDLLEILEDWHINLRGFSRGTMSLLETRAWSCLEIYHDICKILVLIGLAAVEVAFDDCYGLFENLINNAERVMSIDKQFYGMCPVYSFEMGVVPGLYFAAWKCRYPKLRRRALQLLRLAPAQEGLFSAVLYARACEEIIKLEERSLVSLECEAISSEILPPEEFRVLQVAIRWESNEGVKTRPSLTYWLTATPWIANRIWLDQPSDHIENVDACQ